MKIAVLSDIHANNIALQATLQRAQAAEVQHTWFLGDVVDRGPYSQPILTWLRHLDQEDGVHWVIGNHDALLAEILTSDEVATFNVLPREDNQFHREEIESLPDLWNFVRNRFTRQASQPKEIICDDSLYVLVHSSLTDWLGLSTYLYAWKVEISLRREFMGLEKRCQVTGMPGIMFFGHTHVPTLISGQRQVDGEWDINAESIFPGQTYYLDPSKLWLVNPGSVGQPRDMDNRAAFATLDTATRNITFHRVPYDWRSVARQLIGLGRHPQFSDILRDAKVDFDTPEFWLEHYRKAKDTLDEL